MQINASGGMYDAILLVLLVVVSMEADPELDEMETGLTLTLTLVPVPLPIEFSPVLYDDEEAKDCCRDVWYEEEKSEEDEVRRGLAPAFPVAVFRGDTAGVV